MSGKTLTFKCTQPCNNCPYRTDAPLRHWDKAEFEDLLESENDSLGTVYGCHKNNGSVCIGWLMKQDENGFPSIMLRIFMSRNNITRKYMDSLSSPSPLYSNVTEMVKANFPSILKKKRLTMKERELLSLVKKYREVILKGKSSKHKCYAISKPLSELLNNMGILCELTRGYYDGGKENHGQHDWITLKDGRIIDATADQFKKPDGSDMPEIYFGEKPEWYDDFRKSNHYLPTTK